MPHRTSLLTAAFMIPAGLLLPLSSSLAADVSWDNPGVGSFNQATNWNTDAVPMSLDNAIISNGGTAQVLADEVVEVNRLLVQSGALEASDAVLSTGITSSSWETPGDLQVGGIAGETGTLTASGNTAIVTGRVRVGGWTEAGVDSQNMNGTLTMSGTSVLETAAGGGYDFWLGNGTGSSGTLNMSGDSRITVNSSMTSGRAGGNATINLSGRSGMIVTTFANIGEGGTADWTIAEEASFSSGGNLTMGGTTSTLTVADLAAVSVGGEFQIGNGGGHVGTVIMSGGMLFANSWMSIGRQGGTGSVTMSGNAALTKTGNGNLIVGDGSTGTLSVSGTATVESDSDIWVGLNAGSNGTLTISGGSTTTTGAVIVARNDAAAQGTVNLNGGTLKANSIQEGAGTGTVNFDGGTLQAGAASADFITGFEAGDVVIRSGGAVIDTNAFDVEITLALTGEGGLVKLGDGVLTLSGVNTYEGGTAVFGGTLSITNGFLADGANVSLASGAIFDLDFAGSDTVQGLSIDGEWQPVGTYGGMDSDADFKLALFTGDGVLNVTSPVPEPGTVALIALGFGVGALTLRRRRRANG